MDDMEIIPSITSSSEGENQGLCPQLSTTFDDEDHVFFSSLYARLERSESIRTQMSCNGPDLRFAVGNENIEAHLFIMKHFCSQLGNVLVKEEDGGVGREYSFHVCVPGELGTTPEALRTFRRAIYLKEFNPSTFLILVQVRRLAEHFGCGLILDKCDQVKVTLRNAHILYDNWPRNSGVKKCAFELIQRNVKQMIDQDLCNNWSQRLWVSILGLDDFGPPVPTEEGLFRAFFMWKERNQTTVSDDAQFRSAFKDLFKYSLMTPEFLISKSFGDCGFLRPDEILKICYRIEEKRSEGINRNQRSSIRLTDCPYPALGEETALPALTVSRQDGTSNKGVIPTLGAPGHCSDGSDMPNGNKNRNDIQLTASCVIDSPPQPNCGVGIRPGVKSGPQKPISTCEAPTKKKMRKPNSKMIGGKASDPMHTKKSKMVPLPQKTDKSLHVADVPVVDSAATNQHRRCKLKGGSSGRVTSKISLPPSKLSTPPTPTPLGKTKKSVATNFQELQELVNHATANEEIELKAGIFEGQLKIENLAEGVRIYGAGPTTVIRAAEASEWIWIIEATSQNCSVGHMKFERQNAENSTSFSGLLVNSDGVRISCVQFVGCGLNICHCDGVDVGDVTVESSQWGILLGPMANNATIKNVTLSNITMGIWVRGISNTISNVRCVGVTKGVIFCGEGTSPCGGNTATDLIFTFSNEDRKAGQASQIAVQIANSDLNKPTGGSAITCTKNIIRGVSGGFLWVAVKDNVVQNAMGCHWLASFGCIHDFTHCNLGIANLKETCNVVCTYCKVDVSSEATVFYSSMVQQ